MARIPRELKLQEGFGVHKVWRGHNRENNLGTDQEKQTYLDFLNEDLENGKYERGCLLQALTLMSNHTHEIAHLLNKLRYSEHMRRHHGRYGIFFNRLKSRCGKVAQDRAHTTLLGDAEHEMRAVLYVHANPVRANIVREARHYAWSTHNLYAFGQRKPWMRNVKFPDWYLALGKTWALRQRAYRQAFARYLKEFAQPQSILKAHFYGPAIWQEPLELAISLWRRSQRNPAPS